MSDQISERDRLFIDSAREEFEATMEAVANRIANNDLRFGILPKTPRQRARERGRQHG